MAPVCLQIVFNPRYESPQSVRKRLHAQTQQTHPLSRNAVIRRSPDFAGAANGRFDVPQRGMTEGE